MLHADQQVCCLLGALTGLVLGAWRSLMAGELWIAARGLLDSLVSACLVSPQLELAVSMARQRFDRGAVE